MTNSIGNCAGNEVCGWVIGTRVIELTYLFRIVEHGNVCKSVSQTAVRKEACKILKGFIRRLILEGGDESDFVRDDGDGCIGGIWSFNNIRMRIVGENNSGGHLQKKAFW